MLALNKVDRLQKEALLPLIERYDREVGFADIVPISALTGENVDRLEQRPASRTCRKASRSIPTTT